MIDLRLLIIWQPLQTPSWKCVFAGKEGLELRAGFLVEEDALGPALAGAEDIAIAEAATGDHAAEILQRNAAAEDVRHVHIDRLEAGAMEGMAHLHLAVHPLFAQDGDPGLRRGLLLGPGLERQHRPDARIAAVELELEFLFGARGVVTHRLDAAGDVRPDGAEIGEAFVKEFGAGLPDAEGEVRVERADARDAGLESVIAQHEVNLVEVFFAYLDDGAQFLVEQRGERVVQVGNLEVDARVAGEGHLRHGGQQAAVGAVVIGENLAVAAQQLDRVPKILQVGGLVDVGRLGARLRNHLREDGAAEAVLAVAEVDEQQDGVLLRLKSLELRAESQAIRAGRWFAAAA